VLDLHIVPMDSSTSDFDPLFVEFSDICSCGGGGVTPNGIFNWGKLLRAIDLHSDEMLREGKHIEYEQLKRESLDEWGEKNGCES
jgi:hypothetical protein